MEGTALDDAFMYKPLEVVQDKQIANQDSKKPSVVVRNNTSDSALKSTSLSQLMQNHMRQPQPQSETHTTNRRPPIQVYENHIVQQPFIPTPVIYPNTLSVQKSASYFDAMVNKRKDVLKMVSFAAIILLAISVHNVVDFGLKEFILSNEFSFKQEVGIRLVYPLAVVFLLWNLKACLAFGR